MPAVLEVLVDPIGSVDGYTRQQLEQKAGEVACSTAKLQYLVDTLSTSGHTAIIHQKMRKQGYSM